MRFYFNSNFVIKTQCHMTFYKLLSRLSGKHVEEIISEIDFAF